MAEFAGRAGQRFEAEIEEALLQIGVASTARTSRLSRSITSGGVLAGTKKPFHVTTSKPLTPASSRVGTSGA